MSQRLHSHLLQYYGGSVTETYSTTSTRRLDWLEARHYLLTVSAAVTLTLNLPYDVRNEVPGLKLVVWNAAASVTSFTVAGTSLAANEVARVYLVDNSTAGGTYLVRKRSAAALRTVHA